MEEKKLTEKLRICSKTYHVQCGVTCGNKVFGGCRNILMAAAVDLINSKNETITEQKAEIERLKGFLQTFRTVLKEKDEQIEKSVEEVYADFMKEYKLTRQDIKESLERETELQKQVDELTENLEKAYATERDNIRAEIANAGTSCHWCLQQAVKDTAKEIYDFAKRFFEWDEEGFVSSLKSALYEHYGVEVE